MSGTELDDLLLDVSNYEIKSKGIHNMNLFNYS